MESLCTLFVKISTKNTLIEILSTSLIEDKWNYEYCNPIMMKHVVKNIFKILWGLCKFCALLNFGPKKFWTALILNKSFFRNLKHPEFLVIKALLGDSLNEICLKAGCSLRESKYMCRKLYLRWWFALNTYLGKHIFQIVI